jgi:hypothetical protein
LRTHFQSIICSFKHSRTAFSFTGRLPREQRISDTPRERDRSTPYVHLLFKNTHTHICTHAHSHTHLHRPFTHTHPHTHTHTHSLTPLFYSFHLFCDIDLLEGREEDIVPGVGRADSSDDSDDNSISLAQERKLVAQERAREQQASSDAAEQETPKDSEPASSTKASTTSSRTRKTNRTLGESE